jgi:hypothetical protein
VEAESNIVKAKIIFTLFSFMVIPFLEFSQDSIKAFERVFKGRTF